MTNIIAKMTNNCPREDCRLTSRGGATTCMGWSPQYDKHGNRVDCGDPNIHTQSYRCHTCGREWVASTQYGKTTFNERKIDGARSAE